MFFRLALILILLPCLEFLGLRWFAQGWVSSTIILSFVFGSAILGGYLARRQGLRYWAEFNRQLDRGEETTTTVLHGCLTFFAGLLMIVPGLLTSLLGLMLMTPLVRAIVIAQIRLRFLAYRHRSPQQAPADIIDV